MILLYLLTSSQILNTRAWLAYDIIPTARLKYFLLQIFLCEIILLSIYSGLGKNPGFSSKNQPSGFNRFKPVLMGFLGKTGENSDTLSRFRFEEPNLENQKKILQKMSI